MQEPEQEPAPYIKGIGADGLAQSRKHQEQIAIQYQKVTGNQLRAYVAAVETIEARIDAMQRERAAMVGEARAAGFAIQAIEGLIRRRERTRKEALPKNADKTRRVNTYESMLHDSEIESRANNAKHLNPEKESK